MPIKKIITCLFLSCSLSGCSFLYDTFVYQIDVTQGNYLDEDKLDEVEIGMTQEQIIFLLGSPMLIDQFDSSKWYYIRYIKPGGEAIQQQQVIFTFDKRELVNIEREAHIADNPLINNPNLKTKPNRATESSNEDQTPQPSNALPTIIE